MIGRHLIDAILQRDHFAVRALVLPGEPVPEAWGRVQVVHGNVCDAEGLARFVAGAEAVLHLAALVGDRANRGSLDEARRVNVGGTRNLLTACAQQGVERFLLLSTCSVYGLVDPRDAIIDESHPSDPMPLPYDRSKAEAEALALDLGATGEIAVAALQLPVVLGGEHTPPGRPTALGLMRQVRRGVFPSCLGGPTWANFVWGGDVAQALIALVSAPSAPRGRFIFSEALSYDEVFRRVGHALGVEAVRIPVPRPILLLAAKVSRSLAALANRRRFSAARLQRELSLGTTTGALEGLDRTVAHCRRMGLLS